MPYDIAETTRALQTEFRLFGEGVTNRATPENVAVLLTALADLTRDLEMARATVSNWAPDASVPRWDAGLASWKTRLAAYVLQVSKAPPGDRQDILWSVTAPLLLGLYGGENSTLPQRPLDAVTPFMLANQLEVSDAWRTARWDALLGDLEDGARAIPSAAMSALPWVAGATVLAWIWWTR